jgi:hypothetical protein
MTESQKLTIQPSPDRWAEVISRVLHAENREGRKTGYHQTQGRSQGFNRYCSKKKFNLNDRNKLAQNAAQDALA